MDVWAVALEFLGEAERFPAATLPRMTTHAAYYAMFHGARAVLLKIDGLRAPTKHNVVVGRFGYHAKQSGDPAAMLAGRALNDMQTERLNSDYDTRSRPNQEAAKKAVVAARTFLMTCASIGGFPPP